jgi:ureidoacrylate peracid hydrolase
MNRTDLPQDVLGRAVERRGTLHPLADFEASRCALLVIDMQNFFIDMLPEAARIIPNVNRLASSLRNSGGHIVWVSMTANAAERSQWSVFYDRLLSESMRESHLRSLAHDAEGWQLHPDLEVDPQDWRVEKLRFSPFIYGSSDLEPQLRERGIDTLLVAGAATNVACESTARDAMMLNFATILVSDALVATDAVAQQATLANFQTVLGDVLSVDEILAGVDKTVMVDRASLQISMP